MNTNTGEIKLNPTAIDLASGKFREIFRPLTPQEKRVKRIAPNSPCGCGSGKKFKKCCYSEDL